MMIRTASGSCSSDALEDVAQHADCPFSPRSIPASGPRYCANQNVSGTVDCRSRRSGSQLNRPSSARSAASCETTTGWRARDRADREDLIGVGGQHFLQMARCCSRSAGRATACSSSSWAATSGMSALRPVLPLRLVMMPHSGHCSCGCAGRREFAAGSSRRGDAIVHARTRPTSACRRRWCGCGTRRAARRG